jgi:hypothetical protein
LPDDLRLYLISANKSRSGDVTWNEDDYDVREGSRTGPVIGRIYKTTHSPSGKLWFWGLNLFPAMAADRGHAASREEAMQAIKARWSERKPQPSR